MHSINDLHQYTSKGSYPLLAAALGYLSWSFIVLVMAPLLLSTIGLDLADGINLGHVVPLVEGHKPTTETLALLVVHIAINVL